MGSAIADPMASDSEEEELGSDLGVLPTVTPPPKLRVVPKFIGIDIKEAGVLYGETIVIKNVDNRTHNVRLRQPDNRAVWSVEPPSMNVKLAPGIETTIQIFFCTDELLDFNDVLQIASEHELVEVPLEARAPAAHITERRDSTTFEPSYQAQCPTNVLQLEGDFDLGVIVNESTVRQQVHIVNTGPAPTEFKVAYEKSPTLQLSPLEGTIAAHSETVLEAVFKPTELGGFTSPVELDFFDGKPKRRKDISAQVVNQNFELLKGDGNGGPLRKLMFGAVYFHDTYTVHAEIFNNGPTPTDFEITLKPDKNAEATAAAGDEEEEEEAAKAGSTGFGQDGSQALQEAPDSSVQCYPMSGPLGPYEKVLVTFTFHPEREVDTKGFYATQPTLAACTHEHIFLFSVAFSGFKRKIKIPVIGKGVLPGIKLVPDKIRFGEVPMNNHADCVVLVENESDDLPVKYNFGRGTFFTVKPSKGTIAPGQGHCDAHTKLERRVLKGGTELLPKDFRREKQYVEEGGFPSTKPNFKRIATIDKEEYAVRYTELVADKNTLAHGEALRKAQHKDKWTEFLKTARQGRSKKTDDAEKRRLGLDPVKMAMDPISLGLQAYSGLKEPKLEMPDPREPLFLVPSELAGGALARPRNRPAYQLEDGTVSVAQYKPKPDQPQELKDCIAVLGTHEITKLVAGPPVIDFGKICAMARMKKIFAITNNLQQSIYIKLNHEGIDEITAEPETQVVPPGATAGLGVQLCVPKVQSKYKQMVTYSLNNGAHTFSFEVQAEVVPVNLLLDRETIIFKFTAENWEPYVAEKVVLTNPNTYPADFLFEVPGPAFQVDPIKGTVDAKSTLTATIRWTPSKLPGGNECNIILNVEGATSQRSIRCMGENPEGKCVFREKSVDLKEFSVGVPTSRFLTLKNAGASDAFFLFDLPKDRNYTLQVKPERGRLAIGGSTDVEITFESSHEGVYDMTILMNVRGGKTVKLPFHGQAIVPRVTVAQDEFNFDTVYIGGNRVIPTTLVNDSGIMAELELNLQHYGAFSVDLPKENWSTSDYDDCPVVRLATGGVPLRTPDMKGLDQKRVPKDGKEPEGDLYSVSVAPNKSLTFNFIFRPLVVESYAFELPLVLTGYSTSDPSNLNKVVVAEGLQPKLLVSSTIVDFGSQIVLNERVKKIPYTMEITFTNSDVQPLEWVLGKPQSVLPPGSKNIFKVEPKEGVLKVGEECSMRFTFLPRDALNYSVQIPLFLRSQMDKEYVSIKLSGMGTYPRMTFSDREVELPSVPLGVTSVALFYIENHGYDNLELKYKLPADTTKIPLTLSFPEGCMIGIAKQRLPVELSFVCDKPMTFTATVEFIDDDGNRFGIPVTGTTDNCIFTTAPFLAINEDNLDITSDEGKAISLSVTSQEDQTFMMPDTLWDMEWPVKILTRWINVTDQRATILDIRKEMVESRGQRMIELVEYISGKPVPGKSFKLSPNKKEQAEQMLTLYEQILMHLKSFGALLNDVKPELLIDIEDFKRLLYTMEQRVRMSDQPTQDGDMLPHWVKLEENWEQVSTGAWIKLIYQIVKVFVLCRVTPKQFKSVAGVDPTETGNDITLAASNLYSVSECILLKWMTGHFKRALPQNCFRVTNFEEHLSNGLVLYSVLVCHWPSLEKYFPKLHKPPKTQRQTEENCKLVIEMLTSLDLTMEVPELEELMYPDPREMLLLVIYLYHQLPQLIPKTMIEFTGLLGQEMVKSIELTNPSNREISYSVRLQGSRMFTLGDVLVRLPPKTSQAFEVRCLPRTSRAIAGRLIFTSRKEAGAQAATLVFGLVCHVQSHLPIRNFKADSRLFEMNQTIVEVENPFPADCDFVIKLQQELVKDQPPEEPEEDPRSAARRGNAEKKKPATPQAEPDVAGIAYPHAFGLDRRGLRMKEGDKINLTAAFLPFTLGKHRVHIKFTSEEFGDFVYEIIGEATLPVTTHSFRLQAENSPSAIMKEIFLPFANNSLETAKRQFLEKHPLNKQKDQGDLIRNPKEVPKELVYTVESSNSLITAMPTVTLFNIGQNAAKKTDATGKQPDGKAADATSSAADGQQSSYVVPPNTLVLSLRCIGPGTYPGTLILKSGADTRVVELEFVVTPNLMAAELDFQCTARRTIVQDIPLVNSSDKQITIGARLSGKSFSGKQSISVGPSSTEYYQLSFFPNWIGEYSGELILQIQNSHEGNIYKLKGTADEPLAESHYVVECSARVPTEQAFEVPNILGNEMCEYTVYSDLDYVSGDDRFTVAALGTGKQVLSMQPFKSGISHGTVTFIAPNGQYVWYTLEVRSKAPAVQEEVQITCEVRKAVLVQVTLTNPVDEELDFDVEFHGQGIFGPDHIILGPEETKCYELIYSPLVPGSREGSLHFVNELAGEYWYKLHLHATQAPPSTLPEMNCAIGSRCSRTVIVDNPLDEEVSLTSSSSNARNFAVSPKDLVLPPFASAEVNIEYIPSSLSTIENGEVTLSGPVLGKLLYYCSGRGEPPTTMETTEVAACIKQTQSSCITFQNPFASMVTFNIRLDTAQPAGVFALMLKRTRGVQVAPFSSFQVPFAFTPESMDTHLGEIVLEIEQPDSDAPALTWHYPIKGMAEIAPGGSKAPTFFFSTKARTRLEQEMEVQLVGLADSVHDEAFTHDLIIPETDRTLLKKALSIEALDEVIRGADVPLRFKVVFEPQRVCRTKVDFVVNKNSGGRWRFELQLEATQADMDGTIHLEAQTATSDTHVLEIANPFPGPTPIAFTAFMSVETPGDFTVYPEEGMLHGDRPARVEVTFAPFEFGKPQATGQLTIQTENMQWLYNLTGSMPKYTPPVGVSHMREQQELAEETKRYMAEMPKRLRQKNHVRDNLKVALR